ncbi:MAG: hypothetical protein KAG12_00445, partial [Desulfuromusa sp.]|nr:hypothetical protein [Desulfuromusa sp.]
QSADFEASFDPVFVYAEFSYWLGLEAGVGIDGLGNFEIFSAQALLNGGVRTPNPTMIWVRGEVSYSLLGGIVKGDWGMRFVWPEDADQATIQQATWDCFDSFDPEDATEDFNIWRSIKGVMTTPVGRKITFQDEKGDDLDIKVTLNDGDVDLYCTTCVGPSLDRPSMPGKVLWNNSKIAFTFEPDYFLEPNQTYVVEAKATAEGSLLINGSYVDATTFTFTTGDFPSSIDLLVKDSYPKTGRRFCYTGYPIQVELNRALPVLENNNIEAHLVTEDGTEVPGVYTLADDYRSLQFVPDAYLSQNTFYEFKLVNPLMSGMTKSAPGETTAETPETPETEENQEPKKEILDHMHTVDPEDLYLAQ